MAEDAVDDVLQDLSSLLAEEATSFRTIRPKIESIKHELEMIKPFLRNADERAAKEAFDYGESDGGIQTWVQQIGSEAHCIEDVIEEYIVSAAQHHHGAGLAGTVARLCIYTQMLKQWCKIVSDVSNIKTSLAVAAAIDHRRKRSDFTSTVEGSGDGTVHTEFGSTGADSYFSEFVGRKSVERKLIDWLISERTQQRVLILVGAGGLGKTTLAACVYKSDDARNLFDCYAWIDVGRVYNRCDVFRKLIRTFLASRKEMLEEDVDKMDNEELSESLRSYLSENRYMIVFDDVREAEFWKHVQYVLPNNKKANRIIITTHYKAVGEITPDQGDDVRVHMLEKLSSEETWELFCKKTFLDSVCPAHLEELSLKILEKCGGLPLAILAIGSLLSKKNQVREWREILKNLDSDLQRDIYLKDGNRVICESYKDLPHHLKSCLLYFASFPDSFTIECDRLFRLWIAEGFVQHESNNRLSKEAEIYLNELIARSMVQVSDTTIDGKAVSVRVHEVIREIIQRNAELIGFGRLLNQQEAVDLSRLGQSRRITLYKCSDKVVERVKNAKVHSLFLLEIDELPSNFISTLPFANFKFMKVLDLEGTPLGEKLPKEIGKFFNLRFLSLKKTKVKVLHRSIGRLSNLQTLDLRHTLVSELPNAIRKLKKLRCLLGGQLDEDDRTRVRGMKVNEGIGCLTELEELAVVEIDVKVVKELRKLTKLKKLGVRVTAGKGLDICPSISAMEALQSLEVETIDLEWSSDLQFILPPPQGRLRLYSTGYLKSSADWISNLQTLVQLRLARSGLLELPNLMELSFIEACNSEYSHLKKEKSLARIDFQESTSMNHR